MPLKTDNEQLIANILAKNWEQLEVVETDDALMFHETITRRRGKEWEDIPVLLKVPREPDIRGARLMAIKWANEEGIDRDTDQDMFEHMEDLCLLCLCVRSSTPPHEPYEPFVKQLEKRFDRPVLNTVYAKLEALKQAIDPRPCELTNDQTLAMVGAIAEARNVVPLVALDSLCQSSLVVTMADQLLSLLPSKSSSEPSAR